jgi:signal transduction histidine kinase/CheY-like chemotaxis protein
MRRTSLTGHFALLLVVSFSALIALSVWIAYSYSQYHRIMTVEGSRLVAGMRESFALSQELFNGVQQQVLLLRRHLENPDPSNVTRFLELNRELGAKRIRYLRIGLGDDERLTVAHIQALEAELGVKSMQLFERLERGDRLQALEAMSVIEQLRRELDRTLEQLGQIQLEGLYRLMEKLRSPIIHSGVLAAAGVAYLLLVTLVFVVLIRKRVLEPLNSVLRASEELRAGNLQARAEVRGESEIARLATGFNFMAESLQSSYADLEKKVQERTTQLAAAREQLTHSEKMSALGQLVSGVAHELNNPLTAIIGFAELCKQEETAGGAAPDRVKNLDQILSQAERCKRTVLNLAQFASRTEASREPLDFNQLVERVLKLREYELTTRSIQLSRQYDQSNPRVQGDPDKLQQVILNLLNNSVDAIQEGGQAGRIWVSTRVQGDFVWFEMKDDGGGILQPKRVFDPFYTTKSAGKGGGLGLSICYGIVTDHGGDIRAENWQGGARLLFSLPLQPAASEPALGSLRVTRLHREKPAVALIVDDEESLLELQVSFLDRMGIEAVSVASGEEALKILKTRPIDVVLSDIRMPGSIDGLRFYEWVCGNFPHLSKRFVFISGDLTRAEELGFTGGDAPILLRKPFTFAEYSDLVLSLLQ